MVPLRDRKKSPCEFLNVGCDIDERASEIYENIPKSRWRSVGNRIESYGAEIIDQLIAGNGIDVKTLDDYKVRRRCFQIARMTLFKLSHRIDTAQTSCNLSDTYVEQWQGLIDRELSLVEGEITSARRRYAFVMHGVRAVDAVYGNGMKE